MVSRSMPQYVYGDPRFLVHLSAYSTDSYSGSQDLEQLHATA